LSSFNLFKVIIISLKSHQLQNTDYFILTSRKKPNHIFRDNGGAKKNPSVITKPAKLFVK